MGGSKKSILLLLYSRYSKISGPVSSLAKRHNTELITRLSCVHHVHESTPQNYTVKMYKATRARQADGLLAAGKVYDVSAISP